MRFRPIAALIVLLLVAASLSFAGCITSTTNQTPSATSASTTAAHNAFLESYLSAYKVQVNGTILQLTSWEVTWLNSTSALAQYSLYNVSSKETAAVNETFLLFPTSQDAASYLNSTNLTSYRLNIVGCSGGQAYQNVTGHNAQTCKQYLWDEGNPPEVTYHMIIQIDILIRIYTSNAVTYAS
jgi:hypothetical protein